MSQVKALGAKDRSVDSAASEAPVTTSALDQASALDPDLARVLTGTDIIAARKALAALPPRDRERVFKTPIGTKSLVPVLDAARCGSPHMLALFEGMGAALNV